MCEDSLRITITSSETCHRVALQELAKQVRHAIAEAARHIERAVLYELVHCARAAGVKGRDTNHHFIQQDTEAPPIHVLPVPGLCQNLGCQVLGGATERLGLAGCRDLLAQPEVRQCDVAGGV